jgi:hypothetical protein
MRLTKLGHPCVRLEKDGAALVIDPGVWSNGALCRLRYVGSAHQWQFAIYRASHNDYNESIFPTGLPVGTCQDALDTVCGLYINDLTAWT